LVSILRASLAVLLASSAAVAQRAAPSYVQRGGEWYRVESYGTFRVDPEVISVRFRPPIEDLVQFRAAAGVLPGPAGAAILQITAERSNSLGIHDLRLPPGADLFAVLQAFRASGLVEFAEENTFGTYVILPNDGQFWQQWHLRNTGQTGGTNNADVDADLAWDVTVGVPSVVIAVLDSGTEITHPDLSSNMWKNAGEIAGNGIDDDGNGFVDDRDGWDFGNNNNQVSGPFFHGTFVAGLISARTNNVTGVCGLAGGFNGNDGCRAMPLGVGDFGPNGAILDDAILYAANNGARVITLSLSIAQSAAIDNALSYANLTKGIFIDCAAGNGGSGIAYPATSPHVVAVGATDHNDVKAGFSNFGSTLWVVAPGVAIHSTTTGGGYTNSDGTSFSAPLVGATAGLMLSVLPSLTPANVKEILKLTAKDLGPAGFDISTGWGRINAHDAVLHVASSDCNHNGIYDPTDISSGTSLDANGNGVPDECEVIVYCTAKLGSLGCMPSIGFSGFASATAANGFIIDATNVRNNKNGLLFYGVNGPASSPFLGGTLCVGAQVLRAPWVNSGGTPAPVNDCSGVYAMDFNTFARGVLGGSPLAALSTPGTVVNTQWWGRDPGFPVPNNVSLSNALQFSVGP
jgi:subtilisin family serine protease